MQLSSCRALLVFSAMPLTAGFRPVSLHVAGGLTATRPADLSRQRACWGRPGARRRLSVLRSQETVVPINSRDLGTSRAAHRPC
ncbi:hypothetical protein T484DRAFT_2498058 [Baffinella frigidus]|nr:hypothetical protein T484DRAFT_2498058 [Cryptophyta sp. CCMP2293]